MAECQRWEGHVVHVGRCIAAGQRVWRFEILEERIALTAQGLPDFFVDYIDATDTVAGQMGSIESTDPAAAIRNDYGLTGMGQTVAIIDSGIAWDHAALGGGYGTGYRVVGGWDFTDEDDANPYDDGPFGSHGTHVAGIIAADSDAARGIAPGVDLVALRVFDDDGAGHFEWVENALEWVHDNRGAFAHPITTVNLSLGTRDNSNEVPRWAMLEDELAQLEADGIFVVAAAGNAFATSQESGLGYPASSNHVVPVMSVDADGQLSDFSQRASHALAAPGRWITSSVPDYVGDQNGRQDDFARYSGTSMASPYVAGASVLVREAMTLAGLSDVSPENIYDVLQQTSNQVDDPITGISYRRIDVAAAIAVVLPDGPGQSPPPDSHAARDVTDLGAVDLLQQTRLACAEHSTWYRVEAVRDGLLTVAIQFADARGNVDLEVFDGDFVPIGSSATRADQERIDVAASAGDTYYFRLIGANDNVDVQLANLVAPTGNSVRVFGTAGDDTFQFLSETTHQLTINGIRYELANEGFVTFSFDGDSGNDRVNVVGSTGDDIAVLGPGRVEVSSGNFRVTARNVETASIDGRLGNDVAYLHDSPADDVLVSQPVMTELYGVGYHNSVTQFERVYAYASGGHDEAYLYDSTGDDILHAEPKFAKLYGRGHFNYASQFEHVYGYASSGYDKAYLYDSVGDGILRTDTALTELYGQGFHNYAAQFDRVYGHASNGTVKSYRYDFARNDVAETEMLTDSLSEFGANNEARVFDQVYACVPDNLGSADPFDVRDPIAASMDRSADRLGRSGLRNDMQDSGQASPFAEPGNHRVRLSERSGDDRLFGRDSVTRRGISTSRDVACDSDRVVATVQYGNGTHVDIALVDDLFVRHGRGA